MLFAQESYADAITSFHKALSIDNNHTYSLVHLSRVYMKMDDLEMAEGLLDSVTKSNGWNCAEAWYVFFLRKLCIFNILLLDKYVFIFIFFIRFYLGKIYQATNRVKRTKDCLWYALELEETNPVRSFSILPGCL